MTIYNDITINILIFSALLFSSLLLGALATWLLMKNKITAAEHIAELRYEQALQLSELKEKQYQLEGHLNSINNNIQVSQNLFGEQLRNNFNVINKQLNENFNNQTTSQSQHMTNIQERLAVIDNAQRNIQSLAGEMVKFQHILSNKQTRGAFGQARMEAIITDAMPDSLYEFQAILSNGKRPDCIIKLPKGPQLVIDAKFPLEAWEKFRAAANEQISAEAFKQFSRDMDKHILDISEKYLISGETYDTAFLFVPSESIFADIQEHFQNLVQKAYRHNVVIVSPSLLLLSIQVIQALFKDMRMNEQAKLIQREVEKMSLDVKRLDERVQNLAKHFNSTAKDIDEILISSQKITKTSHKITTTDLTISSATYEVVETNNNNHNFTLQEG